MDQQGTVNAACGETNPLTKGEPRSLRISERGIKTASEFASLMTALMSDVLAGRITPNVGNAACNAGSRLLKAVEMQYRYGTQGGTPGERVLILADDDGK